MSIVTELAQRILDGPGPTGVSLDDRCARENHDAKFSKIPLYVNVTGYECRLTCYHNGNYVGATGRASHTGDAFVVALKQIELTIGTDWRTKGQ